MVLSDPGAAFVSGAVRCCYGYSKLQEIPWSVLSPVESWRISYEAVWSVLKWLKSSLLLTWLHFVAGSEEQTGIKWVDAGCRSWALCCYKPPCLGDPGMVFAECTSTCVPFCPHGREPHQELLVVAASGPQLIPRCSNYKNSFSWFEKFRIDFCYHCSINSRFVGCKWSPFSSCHQEPLCLTNLLSIKNWLYKDYLPSVCHVMRFLIDISGVQEYRKAFWI